MKYTRIAALICWMYGARNLGRILILLVWAGCQYYWFVGLSATHDDELKQAKVSRPRDTGKYYSPTNT